MSAPCLKCGNETTNTVSFSGLIDGTIFMCESCFNIANEELTERRRQFNELIDAGVPRASANMIMIGRIDEAAKS